MEIYMCVNELMMILLISENYSLDKKKVNIEFALAN